MNKKILKIIGIILLIFLIMFVVWKIISYEEKTFNTIAFEPGHKIFNTTEQNYLDTIVHAGIQNIDIDSIIIVIKPLINKSDILTHGDIDLKAHIVGEGLQYIIYIDKFSRKENIKILSHELIHLKQYYNKDLTIKNGKVLWKDKEININEYSYEKLPWEEEAFNEQHILESKIKGILY